MSFVDIAVAFAKILILLLFFLNMAALGSWADRRQSAMIQDRLGPNRAVAYLPSNLARLVVLLPPSILGGLALLPLVRGIKPFEAAQILPITAQLSVLVLWVSLLLLSGVVRKDGPINKAEEALAGIDPRTIFYAGVAGHAIAFAALSAVPPEPAAVVRAAQIVGALLAGILFVSGIYAASRVPDGKVPLRIAGTLHVVADTLKMIWKEDFIPKHADRLLHSLAPMLAVFPALVTMAVLPFGDKLCVGFDPKRPVDPTRPLEWGDLTRVAPLMPGHEYVCRGHTIDLQIADLNVGILYIFAMAGTGVVGAAIAGWASDNKWSLLGGLRAASQMISYEVALGMSLLGVFLVYGSLRLSPMVDWQRENAWGIFVQPLAFVLFLTASCAENKRIPFDQPEGESEIVAGYWVEYSGLKWGMFMIGEYLELMTSSALLVTLFFGGYALPFLHRDGFSLTIGDTTFFTYKMNHLAVVLISMITFFVKVILMVFVQIFFRFTLPRFRYDQLMKLGWTRLLPLAIANMLVTGVILLGVDSAGPTVKSALKIAADLTQALLALGGVAAFIALVSGLLEPVARKRFLRSTAARFAAALGGTKAAPQQA
jgi:NADH-quinone oxidoreductase subunit H